ncbi:Protein kinase C-like 1 [Podochytrium sp. JEL0797]|nr:Protein kinase C-like 1 [Podochytrium sp. JEL0797]
MTDIEKEAWMDVDSDEETETCVDVDSESRRKRRVMGILIGERQLFMSRVIRPLLSLTNVPAARCYEASLSRESSLVSSRGALVAFSGAKTGRSAGDKRIVFEQNSSVFWGSVNKPLSKTSFEAAKKRALAFLDQTESVFDVKAFAGADDANRQKIRVVCAKAYHALFMQNMLITPTSQELKEFGPPDFTIYNAGQCPADQNLEGVDSETLIAISFKDKEAVILGTE